MTLLPCAYKQLLGIDCPICGLQRSILALINGEWLNSIILFPGLIPILITICLSLVFVWNRKPVWRQVIKFALVIDLVIILGNWILKGITA